ncbi:SDR family oxidoreductase, partial [uncultured Ramlibacter sp.]|uniref:SDR family oxidoreductase n=1 Tax=uncultured Ramlibacter sp. TaxID=260755 RepID=UPI00261AA902
MKTPLPMSKSLRVLSALLSYPDARLRQHLPEMRDLLHAERALTPSRLAELDGLINNAGGMVARVTYENMTEDYFDAVIDLNGRSVISTTTAAIPHLKKQGGFIINTTSVAARTGGTAGSGVYGSSKAFVGAVTKGMALEFGKYAVRVNAVAPGFVETPILGTIPDKVLEHMREQVPLHRLGKPEEIANVYAFLASDEASYINGAVIEVSGWMTVCPWPAMTAPAAPGWPRPCAASRPMPAA